MNELPKRKHIRIEDYDYSTPGAYFITVCTVNREKIFWSDRRGELCSPANVPLSDIGMIVDNEIKKLNSVYDAVRVDKYCIMPDHIHFILSIDTDENGRTQFAPTVRPKQFLSVCGADCDEICTGCGIVVIGDTRGFSFWKFFHRRSSYQAGFLNSSHSMVTASNKN